MKPKLIVADELKDKVHNLKVKQSSNNISFYTGYVTAMSIVEGLIEAMPEVEVAVAKHGHWIEVAVDDKNGEPRNVLRECSVCGNWQIHYLGYVPERCPKCGSMMDEKEAERTQGSTQTVEQKQNQHKNEHRKRRKKKRKKKNHENSDIKAGWDSCDWLD